MASPFISKRTAQSLIYDTSPGTHRRGRMRFGTGLSGSGEFSASQPQQQFYQALDPNLSPIPQRGTIKLSPIQKPDLFTLTSAPLDSLPLKYGDQRFKFSDTSVQLASMSPLTNLDQPKTLSHRSSSNPNINYRNEQTNNLSQVSATPYHKQSGIYPSPSTRKNFEHARNSSTIEQQTQQPALPLLRASYNQYNLQRTSSMQYSQPINPYANAMQPYNAGRMQGYQRQRPYFNYASSRNQREDSQEDEVFSDKFLHILNKQQDMLEKIMLQMKKTREENYERDRVRLLNKIKKLELKNRPMNAYAIHRADGYPGFDDIDENTERRKNTIAARSNIDENLRYERRGAVQIELPANLVQEDRRKGIALGKGLLLPGMKEAGAIEDPEKLDQLAKQKKEEAEKAAKAAKSAMIKKKFKMYLWVMVYPDVLQRNVHKLVLVKLSEVGKSLKQSFADMQIMLQQFIETSAGLQVKAIFNEKTSMHLFDNGKKIAPKDAEKRIKDHIFPKAKTLLDNLVSKTNEGSFPPELGLYLACISQNKMAPPQDFYFDFELKRLAFSNFGTLKNPGDGQAKMIIGFFMIIRVLVVQYFINPWTELKPPPAVKDSAQLKKSTVLPIPNNQNHLEPEKKVKSRPGGPIKAHPEAEVVKGSEDPIVGLLSKDDLSALFQDKKKDADSLKALITGWIDKVLAIAKNYKGKAATKHKLSTFIKT